MIVMQRYLPHELNTRYYALHSYRNGNKATYGCSKYHIYKVSLSRWNNNFNDTKESLLDKSHRPISTHPKSQNEFYLK